MDPTSEGEIRAWMATRPEDLRVDGSVNERSRWKYSIVDHHIWSEISVIDLTDGSSFTTDPDPANF